MNILGRKKYWYFIISLVVILPGLVSLYLYGLNLSIDFIGGSKFTFAFPKEVTKDQQKSVKNTFLNNKIKVETINSSGKELFVRSAPVSQTQDLKLTSELTVKEKNIKQTNYETVGPTIGGETLSNAIRGLLIASALIVIYIWWSFRKVPKPASSLRFGICAIIALLHDVLVLIGAFSLLGHFLGVEVDSLFVTAALTVIGFSVHDTIVVFDRIRENLKRVGGMDFEKTVNDSILQTLDRSLNTSLTVVLVLVALLLFGGESIRWFVVALLIGIISGTYSSVFNAAPLLVVWQDLIKKRFKK